MADNEETESKSGGGLLPIINLVLLVLVLAVGGFVAWKLMNMEQPAEQPADKSTVQQTDETTIPEAEDDANAAPIPLDIDNLTINLADTDRERYLRVKITLYCRSEEAKAKISTHMLEIKDLLLSAISGKKFSEIRTPQGKYELKADLTERINRIVGGHPVKKLLFTDFVSQ